MKKQLKQYALWAGLALCSAGLAQADTLVTFQVDMTQQVSTGGFVPGVNVINARGTFNGYNTYAMTNNPSASNTNLYTLTFVDTNDATGTLMSYKFCIDSGGWESGNNRQIGMPATNNGTLLVPSCYFNDQPRTDVTVNNNVTFQVDMTEQVVVGNFTPGTDTVFARGAFNGWGQTALTNDPSGQNTNLYSITVTQADAPINLEHFKYFIDRNSNWEAPSVPSEQGRENDLNRYYNMLATDGGAIVLPAVYFNDIPPAPPITNTVTFQVDMSVQAALGKFDYTQGDTVQCRGSFNSWNGVFVLTNDPTAANSNLFSGTVQIIVPPTSISYKFWDSNARGSYELPASTAGANRSFTLVTSNATYTLPAVYYADLTSTSDFLTEDTQVTFTVNMTNAINTGGIAFNPSTDNVYLNGDWIPWWNWNDPLGAYSPYLMQNNPVGSGLYSITLTIPKGTSLALTYKYSINGPDNELPPYVNHVREIRTLANYTMPLDKFGTQWTEPAFGELTVGSSANGKVPVSWLGRPGVNLQTKSSLTTGTWQNLPATDGANWSSGYLSTNGFVSVTNYPASGGQGFFRLVKP